ILLLLWLGRKRLTRVHVRWIAAVCGIVLLFTFPWDSWAVGRRIWEFDNSRILFRIGNLPVEEILFFVLETIVVGLVTIHFLPRPDTAGRGE
ncbi:MAG: lycopene cyclase domain-containing protein, partial [Candidatus Kapaibacterium sp.]